MERAELNWHGAWITPTGKVIDLDPDPDFPKHHADLLDDDIPEIYDLHDQAVENGTADEDDFRFFAIEHAIDQGWMRLRYNLANMELSVQFTKPQKARSLMALRKYINDHDFTGYVLELRSEAYPNQTVIPRYETVRDFMDAVNQAQAALRG